MRLIFTLLFVFFFGCSGQSNEVYNLATPKRPQISPTGKYLLKIIEGYDGQRHFNEFEISEIKGKNKEVVFHSKDRFWTRHVTFFLWDREDRVWVYSGDVGTYYWARNPDNQWIKHTYGEDIVKAPEALKKLRPNIHTQ